MKTLNEIISELNAQTEYLDFTHPIFKIWENLPENKYLFTSDLIEKLSATLNEKEQFVVYDLISICRLDGVDKRYTDIFCKLLKEDWHRAHEDIVSLLEEIKDAKSIDTLYETAVNFPDDDDARALSKKCMWALVAINTNEAREKLKLLAQLDDTIIKEEAAVHLSRMK